MASAANAAGAEAMSKAVAPAADNSFFMRNTPKEGKNRS